MGNLGNAYDSLGQYDKAIEHYNQALAISRESAETGDVRFCAEKAPNTSCADSVEHAHAPIRARDGD